MRDMDSERKQDRTGKQMVERQRQWKETGQKRKTNG